MCVFDDAECCDDASFVDDPSTDALDDVVEGVVDECAVIDFCAFVFTESDEEHLHQSALMFAEEFGVGFDAGDDHDVVCCEGVVGEVDGDAFMRVVDDGGGHVGPDGAAAEIFGDAVVFEDISLALRCASAVASHRCDDERTGLELLEELGGGFEDGGDVRYAAAASGDGDGVAGFDFFCDIERAEFGVCCGGDVLDERALKVLADAEGFWETRWNHWSSCDWAGLIVEGSGFSSWGTMGGGDWYRAFRGIT